MRHLAGIGALTQVGELLMQIFIWFLQNAFMQSDACQNIVTSAIDSTDKSMLYYSNEETSKLYYSSQLIGISASHMISFQARAKERGKLPEPSAHVLISFYVIAKYGEKYYSLRDAQNKYTNRYSYYGKEDIL